MKILVVGNSHISMLQQARASFPPGSVVQFAPFFWYKRMHDLFRPLMSGAPTLFELKEEFAGRPVIHGQVVLEKFDVVIVLGTAGGPGDAFRVLAPDSFTGSLDEVPGPQEVACPVFGATQESRFNPPISRAVLDDILVAHFRLMISRTFQESAPPQTSVVIVPTPPMPAGAVTTRFGDVIRSSTMGQAFIEAYDRTVASHLAKGGRRFMLPVPELALTDGWLSDTYMRTSDPREIHANKAYAEIVLRDFSGIVDRLASAA